MNYHRILSQIALVAGTLLFSVGLQTFAAATWSEPTALPPNANAEAPLNTGIDGQIKSGNLQVNALGIQGLGNAFLIPNGNVGIGTTNPQYRFAVGNQNNPFQVSDSGDVLVNGGSDGLWALYYPDASRGALTINPGGFGVHSNLQVDGNATINGTIRGASYGFGGMYSEYYDTWCGQAPSHANPFTGGCSCPSGFNDYLVAGGGGSNIETRIHMCVR